MGEVPLFASFDTALWLRVVVLEPQSLIYRDFSLIRKRPPP